MSFSTLLNTPNAIISSKTKATILKVSSSKKYKVIDKNIDNSTIDINLYFSINNKKKTTTKNSNYNRKAKKDNPNTKAKIRLKDKQEPTNAYNR